jgi:phosphoribosylformylglycinamidine synthase
LNIAVIRFPASNCDLDAVTAINAVKGLKASLIWHESAGIEKFDAVILPGGFSFGDYLRAGAIAARSPAISSIKKMADKGKPILGMCNGFQILVEAGLLPGSLLRNTTLKFVCRWVTLRVENDKTPFTCLTKVGKRLLMPIAHNEGRYFAPKDEVSRLEREKRIVLRYVDENGQATDKANPNGSLANIAGICNEEGNVVGMMPHPERAYDPILSPFGSSDGASIFSSLLEYIGEYEDG